MNGNIEKIQIPLVGTLNVIIFLAFFFAKIFNYIDWSWWWIFSPLWIPIAFLLSIIFVFILAYLIILLIDIWRL